MHSLDGKIMLPVFYFLYEYRQIFLYKYEQILYMTCITLNYNLHL